MTKRYQLVMFARDLKDGACVRYFTDRGGSVERYTLRRSDDKFLGERLICKSTVILKGMFSSPSIAFPDTARLIWDCSRDELLEYLEVDDSVPPASLKPVRVLGFDYGEGIQKSCFYVPDTLFAEAGWARKLYEALFGAGLSVEKGFTFYSKADNYTKLCYTDIEPTRAVKDVRSVYCLTLPPDITFLSLDEGTTCLERYFKFNEDVPPAHVKGAYMTRLVKPGSEEAWGIVGTDVIIFPRAE